MEEKSEQKFNVGDKVTAIISGPTMLVETVVDEPDRWRYRCVWFDTQHNLAIGFFSENMLKSASMSSLKHR
jgi:uncharacterized protein YodC (DUF2158 family)